MIKPWIIGNWKSQLLANEAKTLVEALAKNTKETVQVGIAPSAIYLAYWAGNQSFVNVGTQDVGFQEQGAFTGDYTACMVKSTGAQFSLVGHSERREHHNENDEVIRKKVKACLRHQLMPIVCVGEGLQTRERKQHLPLIYAQIRAVFEQLTIPEELNVVVAYEPVWAIGTGKIPTMDEIEEVHGYIRQLLQEYQPKHAPDIPILYGGSVKPNNAKDIFAVPNVNGALVGGASLKADDFLSIINAY